jgi:hypothetical protein
MCLSPGIKNEVVGEVHPCFQRHNEADVFSTLTLLAIVAGWQEEANLQWCLETHGTVVKIN